MTLANLLINAATAAGGGGIVVALLQGVFNRSGSRAQAAKDEAEAEAREHETWFQEAKDAYARVNKECSDCKARLQQAEDRHNKAIGNLRRELADIKDALIRRADAVDELLPYVQGLPDDKMREIRAANRAVKRAVYRGP